MRLRTLPLVLAAAAVFGCADAPTLGTRGAAPEGLQRTFAAAGTEFGVPPELLAAIGWNETRWEMVHGGDEFPGVPAAHGIMALRGDRLAEGARLAGVSLDEARSDEAANVRAAAALLDSWAREAGIDRASVGAWAPLVARYGGMSNIDAQASYVHHGVYASLAAGVQGTSGSGEPVVFRRMADRPRFPLPSPATPAVDYPSALWRASPNFNDRPTGSSGKVMMVIVHTCEGSYAGCWSWLASTQSGVSAHYVVKEDGKEITQLVREAKRAWHIAATYSCSLNGSAECALNGVQSNHFTIGVEHGGYASQSSFPTAQIDASARLVCDVARDRGVTRDNLHIVGHAKLQPANRTDPGPNWPWSDYLARINRYCS
ncbi:MAG TPA: N-acetylmuramoyl-L-alanine amidase [Gemmatimonadaceae bacterium]|nr:N-acetylmuramoyl-L-alanine amidase [Gemmatimonadaceae bacterium]